MSNHMTFASLAHLLEAKSNSEMTRANGRTELSKPARCFFLSLMLAGLLLAPLFGWPGCAYGEPKATPTGLAPVHLSPRQRQLIGVTFATVAEKELEVAIETTGFVEPDEKLEGYVQTRFPGWIRKVFVNQTYQYVRAGQPLFTVYSPELASAEREYLIALGARTRLRDSILDEARDGADSLVDAALSRLRLFGVPPRELARLKRTGIPREEVEIDSPMSGYVVEYAALPNRYVSPPTRLYTIANLSMVWVYAAVFQDQLGQVSIGTPAQVTVDSYPGKRFRGRVDFIWQGLDTNTRTARVRISLPNPKGMLKLGMYTHVAIVRKLGRGLAIPRSGVLQAGRRNVVFVDSGDGYLRPRAVELGPTVTDEQVVVRSGLHKGERILSSANFLIDSESQLRAALENFGGSEAEESGESSAPISSRFKLAFSTDPEPPRVGTNVLRVTLADSTGKAVDDAEVTAVFAMPAMPTMGMPAMRTEARLKNQGGGEYTGSAVFSVGGRWSVTVRARRNGKELARFDSAVQVHTK